jgi:hypothetical protein
MYAHEIFNSPPQALGIFMSCYDDNIDDDEKE